MCIVLSQDSHIHQNPHPGKKKGFFYLRNLFKFERWAEIIAYDKILEMYKRLTRLDRKVLLCSTDNLLEAIHKIFVFLQLPFDESYLNWKPCTDIQSKSLEWHDPKNTQYFDLWHGSAFKSSGIVTDGHKHSLDEIEDLDDRQRVSRIVSEITPAYRELLRLTQ